MVAEVVLSVMGNRSDRRFPNLSCPWALEAVEMTRRRRADFHQGPERTMKLLKQAEYMAATGFTLHQTIAFRSGLGPYKALDWIIQLTKGHLRKTLLSWLPHYNRGRPHSASGPGIPDPPPNLPCICKARGIVSTNQPKLWLTPSLTDFTSSTASWRTLHECRRLFCGRHAGEVTGDLRRRLLKAAAAVPDVTIHDLRLTLGSWPAAQGCNLMLIGKTLNQSNIASTQVLWSNGP
jgi:hypothetical protein